MFTSATRSQSFPLSTRVGLVYIHRETEKKEPLLFYAHFLLFKKNIISEKFIENLDWLVSEMISNVSSRTRGVYAYLLMCHTAMADFRGREYFLKVQYSNLWQVYSFSF